MSYTVPNAIIGGVTDGVIHNITDLCFRCGTIFLTGAITRELAYWVIKQLRVCCAIQTQDSIKEGKSEKPQLELCIDSDGGDVTSAYMIYDEIRGMLEKCDVVTHVIGHAYSAGALVACAGSIRVIAPHAKMFLHQPSVSGDMGSRDMASIVDMADRITAERNTIARLLAETTGKEPSEVLSAMADERYFTAEQAVDFGLVDYVIT